MAFDLSTAKPDNGGFDLSTAKPIGTNVSTSNTPDSNSPSALDIISRQGGLTSRDIIEGLASPVVSAAGIGAGLYNKGADIVQGEGQGYRFPNQAQVLSNALTKAGLPNTKTWQEKAAAFGIQAISGQGMFNAIGRGLAAWNSPRIAEFGRRLSGDTIPSDIAPIQPTVKDITTQKSMESGYVIPPKESNPNLVNTATGSIANPNMTEQLAAFKNQPITNTLARKDLGLSPKEQITIGGLEDIRDKAGPAYQAVKDLPGTFKTDAIFNKAISNLGGDYATAAKEFPELAKNEFIDTLKHSLTTTEISPTSAVELTKKLRFDASRNFLSDDPSKYALASSQKEAANAIEKLVDRNLQANGNIKLFHDWIQARQLIAKTYTYEGALDQSTGDIIAPKLAQQIRVGKPLAGEAQTIGSFSQAYPGASVQPKKGAPGFSFGDVLLGGGFGAVMQSWPYAALIAGRPALRSAILSSPYQNIIGTPGAQVPSEVGSMLSNLGLQASIQRQP